MFLVIYANERQSFREEVSDVGKYFLTAMDTTQVLQDAFMFNVRMRL